MVLILTRRRSWFTVDADASPRWPGTTGYGGLGEGGYATSKATSQFNVTPDLIRLDRIMFGGDTFQLNNMQAVIRDVDDTTTLFRIWLDAGSGAGKEFTLGMDLPGGFAGEVGHLVAAHPVYFHYSFMGT